MSEQSTILKASEPSIPKSQSHQPSNEFIRRQFERNLPAMTRAQQTISFALLVSSFYLALYLELVPLPAVIQEQIVPVLPFWALVSFGALLLFRLGWGVVTFNDVPEAHKELMAEINEAKADLRKLGVDVD
ncbi:dolichyl-phosphate mannosyltransferase polypeptide 3 [Paramyrothecium foliicola]|nr:dolichyl-phosphate mannosyltransferase polypeptide 3 [Paramyrothecium foliicola]